MSLDTETNTGCLNSLYGPSSGDFLQDLDKKYLFHWCIMLQNHSWVKDRKLQDQPLRFIQYNLTKGLLQIGFQFPTATVKDQLYM